MLAEGRLAPDTIHLTMAKMHTNYRNIVVIGASAGGVEALIQVLQHIPDSARLTIFVVQHIPAYSRSNLDKVLGVYTNRRVKKAEDGELVEADTIYVARADRHLLLEGDKVVVSKGPRENRFRPAVDALFRSAAHNYRNRVVGVVLSGALNDGTSGMWTIKRNGGLAVVQDPSEAMFADMPNGVMQYTEVDHILPAAEIGTLLGTISAQPLSDEAGSAGITREELTKIEIEIAKGKNGLTMGILEKGTPSALACPECHGALTQFEEGKLLRYRCHTGHAHTAESLLASIRENVEKSMWEVMRGMEESHILLNKMADIMEEAGDVRSAEQYRREAQHIQNRAISVQRAIELADLSAGEVPQTLMG